MANFICSTQAALRLGSTLRQWCCGVALNTFTSITKARKRRQQRGVVPPLFGLCSGARRVAVVAAGTVLAGACGVLHVPPAREILEVVILDASKGSAVLADARCAVVADEIRQALSGNSSHLRIVVFRTGGASGSPVLLGDATFTTKPSGFAAKASRDRRAEAFTTSLVDACHDGWNVEATTPLRAAIASGIDVITTAEVEAKARGHVLTAKLVLASDLREEVEPRWRRAIRSPSPANLKALDEVRIAMPASLARVHVCDVGVTRDRAPPAERDNVKVAFGHVLVGTATVTFGACARPQAPSGGGG